MVSSNKNPDVSNSRSIEVTIPPSSVYMEYVILSIPNLTLTEEMKFILKCLSKAESLITITSSDYPNANIKFSGGDDYFEHLMNAEAFESITPFPYTANELIFLGDGWTISSYRDEEYMSICVKVTNIFPLIPIIEKFAGDWFNPDL